MAATTSKSCHVCGKEAFLVCSRCSEGLDSHGSTSPTAYCGEECQTSDFEEHKVTTCEFANARKQLFRGAELAQEAFYTFRETLFTYDIRSFTVPDDDKVHLVIRDNKFTEWPVRALPDGLTTDRHKKRAVLSWRASNLAVAYMHHLLETVFENITFPGTVPQETAVTIKDFKTRIAVIGEHEGGAVDVREFEHVVVNISLVDGQHYIIDVAGAQFGQPKTIFLATEYESEFVERTVASKPFGTWSRFWANAANGLSRGIYDPRIPYPLLDSRPFVSANAAAHFINIGLDQWDEDASYNVLALLNGKRVYFDLAKPHLLAAVFNIVSECDRIGVISTAKGGLNTSFENRMRLKNWTPLRTADLDEHAAGIPRTYTGSDLAAEFLEHLQKFKAEIGEEIKGVRERTKVKKTKGQKTKGQKTKGKTGKTIGHEGPDFGIAGLSINGASRTEQEKQEKHDKFCRDFLARQMGTGVRLIDTSGGKIKTYTL